MADDSEFPGDDSAREGGDDLEFIFEDAKREGLKAIILLFGESGSGKTYSALRLALGLVGPKGLIFLGDTEYNRGKHYANEFRYKHAMMGAPFTPARYLKLLRAAEKQGADCLIIDSISHVQEGEGGLIDMADAEEAKSKNPDKRAKWAKPKREWKKVRNAFLQAKMHVIFCARAKDPLEPDPDNSKKMIRGTIVPIIPRGFPYEVMVSLGLDVITHRIIPTKLPDQLAGAFPLDEFITENSGEAVRDWLDGKVVVDEAFEAVKAAGLAAADKGSKALQGWWESLNEKTQTRAREYLRSTLKAHAFAVDDGKRPEPPATGKSQASGGGDAPKQRNASPPPPPPAPPPPPPPPPPPAAKTPPPQEDDAPDFDELDDELAGSQSPPPPPPPPKKKAPNYPVIQLEEKPDWSEVINPICELIEAKPHEVDAIAEFYAPIIARVNSEEGKGGHPRMAKMLKRSIDNARTMP